jgi:glutathione-regulated potassium-efflux system ancillary protein KefF
LITVIFAHPHRSRSVAHRALLDAIADLPALAVRSLYDLYPDFAIDAAQERRALERTRLVVWQHPLYWYGAPALLKLWFETVLVRGWAFGSGGTALQGRDCLWVTTTGGNADAFTAAGKHGHSFDDFVAPVRQTARFCGMVWREPVVVMGSHRLAAPELQEHAAAYRRRLESYLADHA